LGLNPNNGLIDQEVEAAETAETVASKAVHDVPAVPEDSVDLTILVPCLNEEQHVLGTLDTIAAAMRELQFSYEVLVIDDGSTDRTAELVKDYRDSHPNLPVRLHQNGRNRGLTRTYVDGAFLGRGKYYRMVCGDDVEPKETLVTIFRQLGKADLIIPYHGRVPGKSAFRSGLSEWYTFLVNRFSGYSIHYYNGLPLTTRYNVMRWGPYSFGFGFQAELITRLLDEGSSFIEVPVVASHQPKSGKNSALNWRNFASVSHTLLEILIRRVRRRTFGR
jgi:glycosyltransferase involved in cell wall biosynthesis